MSKYLYDEYGNKYEGMDKNEILETMGATEPRQYVFTGGVTYNNEPITFEYSGVRPSDSQIVSLLSCATDFSLGLSASEIIALKAIGEFKIHVMLCEYDVYITNGHCDLIYIFNTGLGFRKLYENGQNKASYYMTSSEPVNDVRFVTKAEFNNIIIDENTTYVTTDEDFTQNVVIQLSIDGNGNVAQVSDGYINSFTLRNAHDRLILRLEQGVKEHYLKLISYQLYDNGNEYFMFRSDEYIVNITNNRTTGVSNIFSMISEAERVNERGTIGSYEWSKIFVTDDDDAITTTVRNAKNASNLYGNATFGGTITVDEVFSHDDGDNLTSIVNEAYYADTSAYATRAGRIDVENLAIVKRTINNQTFDCAAITKTGLYSIDVGAGTYANLIMYINNLSYMYYVDCETHSSNLYAMYEPNNKILYVKIGNSLTTAANYASIAAIKKIL